MNTIEEKAEHLRTLGQVERALDDLYIHPLFSEFRLRPSLQQLSTVIKDGKSVFRDPLLITQENCILDGVGRWMLARRQNRHSLVCTVRQMTQDETLIYLIQKNRPFAGLNSFVRARLALRLEPSYQEKALRTLQESAQQKGCSFSIGPDRLDVRADLAFISGVCAENLSKVKEIIRHYHPAVLDDLMAGEITINKAWQWRSATPDEQLDRLHQLRTERGIDRTITRLIAKHQPSGRYAPAPEPELATLRKVVKSDEFEGLDSHVKYRLAGRIDRLMVIHERLLDSLLTGEAK